MLKSQFKNLSFGFYCILFCVCLFVFALTYLANGSLWSFIVALSGILYAFFAGERRVVCFIFGIFYSLSYACIAYEAKLYGDVMLNLLYLPINFYGLFAWQKHQEQNQAIVRMLLMKGWIFCMGLIAILTFLYGLFLQSQGASFAFLNSFSVVTQVVAFVLQVNRYVQSYVFVTLANIVSVVIWFLIFQANQESIAQLLNMIVFLLIGIFYFFEWKKGAK